jgi:processive 1,2-diacylglycerol beta-glucosyltransferase
MPAAQSSPRALLLPGSIGMGHHAMAAALASSLEARAWQTDTLDAMQLLGSVEQWIGERVFRRMLATPGLYDAMYFTGLRSGGRLPTRMDASASKRIVPKLAAHIERTRPDLVVSIFATAASAMARVAEQIPEVGQLTFCTDLNPHRMWVHAGTDCYLVRSEASAAFVRRFDPEARIVISTAPVRPAIYNAPDRSTARAALGIPADEPCVLLMAGGWGLGPLAKIARALTAEGVQTIAVAGRNGKVGQRLRDVAATEDRLHAFGFTDRIPELMSAANVVITSPGETCSEARVIGRQLGLLDLVAGHGRENLQHELELGNAAVLSTEPELMIRGVLQVLATTKDPSPDVDRRTRWEAALDRALGEVEVSRQARPNRPG